MFNILVDSLDEFLDNHKKKPEVNNSLSDRMKQKQDLERVSNLLGFDVVKSRKLTLDFNKSLNSKPKIKQDNFDKISDEDYNTDFIIDFNNDNNSFNYNNKNNNKHNDVNSHNDAALETRIKAKSESGVFQKDSFFDKGISFGDVISYFKSKGVVGEESLCLKVFLAGSNNLSFGVEGFSGSGKTFIVDKVIDLFNDNDLYRLDLSSKMGVFYDKSINNFRTIYIPELQKALQESGAPIVEVVKNLTEGKGVKRVVTDTRRKGSKVFNISKGKSIIYTLASENYFKKDEELNRRFLRFFTDSSKEHLDNILKYKSLKRQDFLSNNYNNIDVKVKSYFNFLRNLDVKVFDPFSVYVSEFLPRTQKSVGYVDHYFNLVDAVVKFNYSNRFGFDSNNQSFLVSSLEDHFSAYNLYYNEFLNTLKGFSERNNMDEEVDVINSLLKKKVDWSFVKDQGVNFCVDKNLDFLNSWVVITKNLDVSKLSFNYS